MNKKFVISIAFMVVANMVTVFYVNRQIFVLRQTVRELNGIAIKLSPEFESKLEGDLSAIVAGIKVSADNAVMAMSPIVQSAIHDVSSNLVEMCRSKVLGNELEAEQSYQRAVQMLDSGDFALAKIYCLNAINHSPTKKLYFEKLLEISSKVGNETREDLEQIKGVLELGIFQVAADDVLGIRNMLALVIEKIDNMDAKAQSLREDEEKESFNQTLASLRDGNLNCEAVISTNSTDRLILLQRRYAVLRDIDKTGLSTSDAVWIENQEAWTRVSLEYFGLVDSIDSYLLRAEKLLDEGSSKLGAVNVMMQTASQSFSQALGIEMTFLPDTAQNDLQSYADRIEAIEIKFNKVKSKPAIIEIQSLIAKVEGIEVSAPYQAKIDSINEMLSDISQKLPRVYDIESRNMLEHKVRNVHDKLGECRQAQYKAYQSWAIDRCKAGMDKYKSWTRVDIVDAEEVVYDYLIEIDTTLLSPDVARLYQDVLGKQFAELKDHTVKVEIDLAKSTKRQLTSF